MPTPLSLPNGQKKVKGVNMSQPASNIRIDSDRLWDSLMEMAKIGPGVAGGNNRQTLTAVSYTHLTLPTKRIV